MPTTARPAGHDVLKATEPPMLLPILGVVEVEPPLTGLQIAASWSLTPLPPAPTRPVRPVITVFAEHDSVAGEPPVPPTDPVRVAPPKFLAAPLTVLQM